MLMTHAAIIGDCHQTRGTVHLAVCGHRVLPRRTVTGNGYIRAPVRATFVSQIGLCFVILRNEIEDRSNLLAFHFERTGSTQSSTIGNGISAGS